MRRKNPESDEAWPGSGLDPSADEDVDPEVEAELLIMAMDAEDSSEDVEELDEPQAAVTNEAHESSSSSGLTSSDSDSDDDEDDTAGADKAKEEEGLELDEEDPVVKAIASAQEKKKSDHPPDLALKSIPSCICFHPSEDVIATCSYDGYVELHSYSDDENKLLHSIKVENEAIREVTCSGDGDKLLAAFASQTLIIYDIKEGLRPERTITNATPAPVSSLYVIDENLFATGDDDGYVLLWDKRSKATAATLKIGEDGVTSMISNSEKRILVCSSAEGAIYALKIRGGTIQTESEIYDYEFNCLGLFKQESKLAVGNGKGDVYVFNWNEFGKHSDIYTGIGRGEAINALIPITERIIITGGDDGFIRAMNFFPQKYLGVVGKVPYPVDKMDVCNDGHLIASIGADECVKFWNVSYFESMQVSTEDKPKKVKGKAKPKSDDLNKSNLPSSSHQNASDFFKGLL